MIITYLKDNNLLKVEGIELTDISIYTSISITTSLNCKIILLKNELLADLSTTTNLFYVTSGIMYIKPLLFGLTTFVDGIYKIDVKFNKTSGYILAENCIFVDITYKCKVAAYLQNIIVEDNPLDKSEKIGTIVHLLHYGLTNGSNCGCNCLDLCTIFNALKDLLISTEPLNADCGC